MSGRLKGSGELERRQSVRGKKRKYSSHKKNITVADFTTNKHKKRKMLDFFQFSLLDCFGVRVCI